MLEETFDLKEQDDFCITIQQFSSGVECRLFLSKEGYKSFVKSSGIGWNHRWEKLTEEGNWERINPIEVEEES